MSQELFNQQYLNFQYLLLLVQILTTIGVIYFGALQYQINKRIKDLQDYVAISIVPLAPGTSVIKVMNVGKINLYLKQYNIGANTELFPEALLIPAGTGEHSNLSIFIPNLQAMMKMKFYLVDELGKKYISTGQIMVNKLSLPIARADAVPGESITAPQSVSNVAVPEFMIWVFKTEKYNWKI